MRRFVGIDPGRVPAPDETTVCKFRDLLERNGLGKTMLKATDQYLRENGMKIGTGTIVDGTIISAPCSTKNKDGERDPEMHQTVEGQQWYFGMKARIAADSQTKSCTRSSPRRRTSRTGVTRKYSIRPLLASDGTRDAVRQGPIWRGRRTSPRGDDANRVFLDRNALVLDPERRDPAPSADAWNCSEEYRISEWTANATRTWRSIQALAPQCADDSLADRIRFGAARR